MSEKTICPKCGDEFKSEHFKICSFCLTDLNRANHGLPPVHCTTKFDYRKLK